MPEGAGGLFTRHWGLIVGGFGTLLVYAAWHPELRAPLMLVAALEKAGLVALIADRRQEPDAPGMRLTAAFDSICVLVYASYLLRLA